MKILSFNVNGVRSITQKTFISDIPALNADIICLQETKATVEQTKQALLPLQDYQVYGNQAQRAGYSGTAVLTKVKPIATFYEMGIEQHDTEGRITGLEFNDFFLISVYVPNSGSELLRLEYRQTWDNDFLQFIKTLEQKKPVIVGGDFNVAHKPIDLARPKANYNKAAGYMQEEIDGMNQYTKNGIIDIFRTLNNDTIQYTWWSYRAGARERNIGWRIDYFLISEVLTPKIKEAFALPNIYGSDHCPIGITLQNL